MKEISFAFEKHGALQKIARTRILVRKYISQEIETVATAISELIHSGMWQCSVAGCVICYCVENTS